MLIIGHVVITLGAAVVAVRAMSRHNPIKGTEYGRTQAPQPAPQSIQSNRSSQSQQLWSWFSSFGEFVDIRLILVGSLLSDIIDKPIGLFFFRETFSNGRIFSHTLLFPILIAMAGFYIFKHFRKKWLLVLSFGTFTHLILDQMWLTPRTLFWPFSGLSFDQIGQTYWLQDIFRTLFENPAVYIPEIVGGIVAVWIIWLMARKGKLYGFIRYGRI